MGSLRVDVVRCLGLPKCDRFSKSDPYVVLTIGNKTQKTRVINNDLNPVFQESFTFYLNQSDVDNLQLHIQVFDKDRFSDDLMCDAVVPAGRLKQGKTKDMTVSLNGVAKKCQASLELRLTAVDFSTPKHDHRPTQNAPPAVAPASAPAPAPAPAPVAASSVTGSFGGSDSAPSLQHCGSWSQGSNSSGTFMPSYSPGVPSMVIPPGQPAYPPNPGYPPQNAYQPPYHPGGYAGYPAHAAPAFPPPSGHPYTGYAPQGYPPGGHAPAGYSPAGYPPARPSQGYPPQQGYGGYPPSQPGPHYRPF